MLPVLAETPASEVPRAVAAAQVVTEAQLMSEIQVVVIAAMAMPPLAPPAKSAALMRTAAPIWM